MIRIIIENLFVLLIPTIAYIAWVAFQRNDWPGLRAVLREAPLLNLLLIGGVLMLASLTFVATPTRNAPGQVYVPPSVQDGKLEPGHAAPPAK